MRFYKSVSKKNPFMGWVGSAVATTLIVASCSQSISSDSPSIEQKVEVSAHSGTITQFANNIELIEIPGSGIFDVVAQDTSQNQTVEETDFPASITPSFPWIFKPVTEMDPVYMPRPIASQGLKYKYPGILPFNNCVNGHLATEPSITGVHELPCYNGVVTQWVEHIAQVFSLVVHDNTIDQGSSSGSIVLFLTPDKAGQTQTISSPKVAGPMTGVVNFISKNIVYRFISKKMAISFRTRPDG
jgi:hypothetical protein